MNALTRNVLCFLAATGAAAAVTATVAVPITQAANQAERPMEASSLLVRIGDLDVRTAEGAQHVYYRLQRAAAQVCGDDSGVRMQLEMASGVRNCEEHALEPAVSRINSTPLTAIYVHHFPERRGTVAVELEGHG